jgi:uncharacterized protein
MIADLSTRLAGSHRAGTRFAGLRLVLVRLALVRLALVRLALVRLALVRLALVRLALAAPLALAVTGLAYPASAQTAAPAAPQVSPGALLLAKQIVQIKKVDEVFKPIVAGVVTKSRDMFLQTNFMYQKDIDEVALSVGRQFAPRVTELVDASARYYASHFSEQELRDLLSFYQSPLGQKALNEEPKVLDQAMVFAGNWANNLSDEIIQAMRVELKKRGHDM